MLNQKLHKFLNLKCNYASQGYATKCDVHERFPSNHRSEQDAHYRNIKYGTIFNVRQFANIFLGGLGWRNHTVNNCLMSIFSYALGYVHRF